MNYELQIARLSDLEVSSYLTVLASALPIAAASIPDVGVMRTLFAEAGIVSVDHNENVSDVDLGRAILILLSELEQFNAVFAKLLSSGPPRKFALMETTAIVTLAVAALQTNVKFEKKSDGTWSLKIEKKALDSKAAVDLVKKLLAKFGASDL